MNNADPTNRLASQLLKLDEPLSTSGYQEYRMSLENALTAAQRREKVVGRIAGIAFAAGLLLMFVGGSQVAGDFDPWSKNATALSVTLGVLYVAAAVTWPLAMAVYFSRLRPRIRELKEQLRDATLLALQNEVAQLRQQVATLANDTGERGVSPP